MKTSELQGAALDWAVAKCNGTPLVLAPFTGAKNFVILGQNMKPTTHEYLPSTSWAQGGPLIEREGISILYYKEEDCWEASDTATSGYGAKYSDITEVGPTPLVAAMRCYVACKLGDEVDLPKELI